jgi:dihydrofolate synthase/folylpolyglutamate synthase
VNYPDSVRFLYALGNELKTAKFELGRIRVLLDRLGSPHVGSRFIHVAGTNGKGSTCAMIEAALRASGIRTGLYTSPHLLEPTERVRINGEPVSMEEFARVFDQVHAEAERLIEEGAFDVHPSYFETVTAMAFVLFCEKQVDRVVLEVGLGGRLDATNVVDPEICVITPIEFDHEKFLGTSIESIAAEKAGIIKPGVPVVVAPQRSEAERVIRERAAELDARYIAAWTTDRAEVNARNSRISAHGIEFLSPLAGRHQVTNALTAATVLSELGFDPTQIRAATWPGRLERVHENPEVILDGAHNPAGARALADYVAEFYMDGKPVLVFGAMRDKAIEEIIGILFPLFDQVIVTAPDQQRALAPETFVRMSDHPRLQTAPNLHAALDIALSKQRPVFVSGSLFLVAEAKALLQE